MGIVKITKQTNIITKAKLTREMLESYANKRVKVTLFDDDVIEGVLKLGNGFFYEPKKYVVDKFCFRLSHIKKIEILER